MDFERVKNLLNYPKYWKDLLKDIKTKTNYLTTGFHIVNMGVNTDLCQSEDDFYIGDFVILYDYIGRNCQCNDNVLMYNLYYKKLQYCDTLYIDHRFEGKTYTKAIRIRDGESIKSTKIESKIRDTILEFMLVNYMDIALRNYACDNIEYADMEQLIKIYGKQEGD